MTYYRTDQMQSITNELGFSTTYTYFAEGPATSRRFASGDMTTYTYDRRYSLTNVQYMDNSRVTYTFDSAGSCVSYMDSGGQTTYAFDALNRLTGKTDPGALAQLYSYDGANQRTRLVDPDGGIRTYSYDADGRTVSFLDSISRAYTLAYDAVGRQVSMTYNSGLQALNSLDAVGQTVGIQNIGPSNNLIKRWTFSYDNVGSRTTVQDLEGNLSTYTMDAKNRLTQDPRQARTPTLITTRTTRWITV